MKRGDTYTNYGGVTVVIPYLESRGWVNDTTLLVVRGVDDLDASETLGRRAAEFKTYTSGEVMVKSPRLLEELMRE